MQDEMGRQEVERRRKKKQKTKNNKRKKNKEKSNCNTELMSLVVAPTFDGRGEPRIARVPSFWSPGDTRAPKRDQKSKSPGDQPCSTPCVLPVHSLAATYPCRLDCCLLSCSFTTSQLSSIFDHWSIRELQLASSASI